MGHHGKQRKGSKKSKSPESLEPARPTSDVAHSGSVLGKGQELLSIGGPKPSPTDKVSPFKDPIILPPCPCFMAELSEYDFTDSKNSDYLSSISYPVIL